MAFTAESAQAAIETALGTATATGHGVNILRFVDNGNSESDMYCVGISTPYSNVAPRWITVAQSNNAAQAATAILAVFKP